HLSPGEEPRFRRRGLRRSDVFEFRHGLAPFRLSTRGWFRAKQTEGGKSMPELEHRSEEHTSELQSRRDLVCRLLLEKKKTNNDTITKAIMNIRISFKNTAARVVHRAIDGVRHNRLGLRSDVDYFLSGLSSII